MTRSPLHDYNLQLGGRMVDFGGWQMPVQYESVLAEHRAVREFAGFFDVSHLGRFELTGEGAAAACSMLLCNNLDRVEPGRAQYTMMLNQNGGVIDDIIVWWWEEDHYWIMPNAANQPRVMTAFAAQPGCSVMDLQLDTAMIAIQGPDAGVVLTDLLGDGPGRFRTAVLSRDGADIFLAGTGYTGERGAELITDPATALVLVEEMVAAGVRPCGLGSRDTLRLEAGFPLWGQDLSEAVTPIEAGLEFAVDFDHEFIGIDRLRHQVENGVEKRLTGFVLDERGVPRHGYQVRSGPSRGEVTSGNISPGLERGIGFAYLSPPVDEGGLEVEIRGRWVSARIKKPPFYKD